MPWKAGESLLLSERMNAEIETDIVSMPWKAGESLLPRNHHGTRGCPGYTVSMPWKAGESLLQKETALSDAQALVSMPWKAGESLLH